MSFQAFSLAQNVRTTHNIRQTAKHLLLTLAGYCNRNYYCFPSQKTLAEDLSTTRETVNRTMKELVAMGLVDVRKRKVKNGYRANGYTVKIREWLIAHGFKLVESINEEGKKWLTAVQVSKCDIDTNYVTKCHLHSDNMSHDPVIEPVTESIKDLSIENTRKISANELTNNEQFAAVAKQVGFVGDIENSFHGFIGNCLAKDLGLKMFTQWLGEWRKWIAREKSFARVEQPYKAGQKPNKIAQKPQTQTMQESINALKQRPDVVVRDHRNKRRPSVVATTDRKQSNET